MTSYSTRLAATQVWFGESLIAGLRGAIGNVGVIIMVVVVVSPLLTRTSIDGMSNYRCNGIGFSTHDHGFSIEQALIEFRIRNRNITAIDSIYLWFVLVTKSGKNWFSKVFSIQWFAQESEIVGF